MKQIFEIELPFKQSTNAIYAGVHWAKRMKYKDQMRWAMIGIHLKPILKGSLKFEFFFKRNPLDASNCSFMAKMIEDVLTEKKIIPDDNYKIIKTFILSSEKGDKNKVKVTLESEDETD